MHTSHSLTVSPSMHCAGGGAWSGGSALGGAWSRGCLLGGAWSGGVPCLWGGVLVPGEWCLVPGGGCLLWGRCLVPGGVWYPSMHWGRPPCERNSWHTLLKILPCPKLRLRAVKNKKPDNLTFITILEKNAIQTITIVPAKLDVDCTKCHRYQKQLHSYLVLGTKVIINSFKRGRNRFAPLLHTMALD